MIGTQSTRRPRNVDAPRAAAILYGDWGTSKAYVIGLAFAVAGYSSFWLIAPMCLLTALVGVNYICICRHYPDGGGVYASVRHRSEVISLVGAFLLIADYLVTAAISALSAFQYVGVPHPEKYAALSIAVIGALNFFGPRHTGGLAVLVSIPTVIVVSILALFTVPHLGTAIANVQPLGHGFWSNWNGFVGIVLALSGVEAIANATGVMRLDSSDPTKKPSVSRTATPAILFVMVEVCLFTAILGLGMHALGGLEISGGDVNAPGHPGVRDYMLRYLGEVFVGQAFGTAAGHAMGWAVTIVMCFLLLSATNTAIVDLIAIQFLLARDQEIPSGFQRLNGFGVPTLAMVAATAIPVALVLLVKDMAALADLYAVGVVGAIAANLGATSTDRKLNLKRWERVLMLFTFVIMLAIEVSLFVDKPRARVFAVTVLAVGLVLRGLVIEHTARQKHQTLSVKGAVPSSGPPVSDGVSGPPILCATRTVGRTLEFAIDYAKDAGRPLYLLFVREQPILAHTDHQRLWSEDEEARRIMLYGMERLGQGTCIPCYTVSDSPAKTIVDVAATIGAGRLILGISQRSALVNFLRGDIIREISGMLPEEIQILISA